MNDFNRLRTTATLHAGVGALDLVSDRAVGRSVWDAANESLGKQLVHGFFKFVFGVAFAVVASRKAGADILFVGQAMGRHSGASFPLPVDFLAMRYRGSDGRP